MKLRTVFAMSAIVSFLLALGFLLDPPTLLKFFGLSTGASETLLAKVVGASLMGFAALAWFGRQAVDPQALQGTMFALITFSAISFVVTLLAVMARVIRAGGMWVLVILFLASAASFAYFQFAGPRE